MCRLNVEMAPESEGHMAMAPGICKNVLISQYLISTTRKRAQAPEPAQMEPSGGSWGGWGGWGEGTLLKHLRACLPSLQDVEPRSARGTRSVGGGGGRGQSGC